MAVTQSFADSIEILYDVLLVSTITPYFHIMDQRVRIKDDAYVSSSSPGGGTGSEVCCLPLHFWCVTIMFALVDPYYVLRQALLLMNKCPTVLTELTSCDMHLVIACVFCFAGHRVC